MMKIGMVKKKDGKKKKYEFVEEELDNKGILLSVGLLIGYFMLFGIVGYVFS